MMRQCPASPIRVHASSAPATGRLPPGTCYLKPIPEN